MNVSVNAPMSSATPRRRGSYSTRGIVTTSRAGRTAQPLRVAAALLCGEAAAPSPPCRLGRPPLARNAERLAQRRDDPLDRKLAVAQLAALVLRDRPQHRPGPRDDAPLLDVGQRRGREHVEHRLDAALRLVRVLAARPARPGGAQHDLAHGQRARCGSPGCRRLVRPSRPIPCRNGAPAARAARSGRPGASRCAPRAPPRRRPRPGAAPVFLVRLLTVAMFATFNAYLGLWAIDRLHASGAQVGLLFYRGSAAPGSSAARSAARSPTGSAASCRSSPASPARRSSISRSSRSTTSGSGWRSPSWPAIIAAPINPAATRSSPTSSRRTRREEAYAGVRVAGNLGAVLGPPFGVAPARARRAGPRSSAGPAASGSAPRPSRGAFSERAPARRPTSRCAAPGRRSAATGSSRPRRLDAPRVPRLHRLRDGAADRRRDVVRPVAGALGAAARHQPGGRHALPAAPHARGCARRAAAAARSSRSLLMGFPFLILLVDHSVAGDRPRARSSSWSGRCSGCRPRRRSRCGSRRRALRGAYMGAYSTSASVAWMLGPLSALCAPPRVRQRRGVDLLRRALGAGRGPERRVRGAAR